MVNQDLGYRIKQLSERISVMEDHLNAIRGNSDDGDWDNSRLMREWQICKRTAASYRKQGLGFYKRGGRIFYTPEQRSDFKKQQ